MGVDFAFILRKQAPAPLSSGLFSACRNPAHLTHQDDSLLESSRPQLHSVLQCGRSGRAEVLEARLEGGRCKAGSGQHQIHQMGGRQGCWCQKEGLNFQITISKMSSSSPTIATNVNLVRLVEDQLFPIALSSSRANDAFRR